MVSNGEFYAVKMKDLIAEAKSVGVKLIQTEQGVKWEQHESAQQKTVSDEGEKWTHTYNDYGLDKDCILIHNKPDDYGMVLVMNRRGEYVLTCDLKEKPIKPKLTKAEAWDMLSGHSDLNDVGIIMEKYDII